MREALAIADHDYVLAEPGSKSKRLKGKLFGVTARATRRGARPPRRMIAWLVGGLCVATAAGILVNALALQETRHPAPLFGRAVQLAPMREPVAVKTVPVPAPRPQLNQTASAPTNDRAIERTPVETAPIDKPVNIRPRQAAGSQGSVSAGSVSQAALLPANEATQAKHDDPIAGLLKAQPPEPGRTVLAAQRALVKLGFVLEADGVAGAATRQAIERYERERGLPVQGELTPKLLRRLSAESGLSIN